MSQANAPSGPAETGFPAWKVRQILQTIEKTLGVPVVLTDPLGAPAWFDSSGALTPLSGPPVFSREALAAVGQGTRPIVASSPSGGLTIAAPLHSGGRPAGFVTASSFHLTPLTAEQIEAVSSRLAVTCDLSALPSPPPSNTLNFERFSVLIDLLQAAAARISLVISPLAREGSIAQTPFQVPDDVVSALRELSSGARPLDDTKARERLEAIYQTSQDAILMLDKDLRIVAANREFGRVFGADSDAFLGVTGVWLHRWIIKNAKDPVRVSGMIDALLANPSAVLDDEIELLSPHHMILRFYSSPVADKSGAIIGRVLVFRDITRFRRARYDLIGSEKNTLIARVAAGMAHELNNILAAMVAYADFALEDGSSEKIREALKMSISTAEKASELVQRLLTIAGPSDSQRQDIELHVEVGRLLDSMEPELRKANIRLHRQLETVPHVNADPVQILQAVRNVLDNSAQAISRDGTISIRTETDWDRGNVRLAIADSGPGIPNEFLDRIFDPFFTTKGVVSGGASTGAKGLGLSVAKGIVEGHGGKIYAGNVLPHGASFVIELPIIGGSAAAPPSPDIY